MANLVDCVKTSGEIMQLELVPGRLESQVDRGAIGFTFGIVPHDGQFLFWLAKTASAALYLVIGV